MWYEPTRNLFNESKRAAQMKEQSEKDGLDSHFKNLKVIGEDEVARDIDAK